jgi:IS5 family transposase
VETKQQQRKPAPMFQDRFEIDKDFEYIIKPTIEMDPVVAQINELLDDEELYQLIRNDLAKRFPLTEVPGRISTPAEVIL